MKRLLALGTSVIACSTSAALAAPYTWHELGRVGTSWAAPYAGTWAVAARSGRLGRNRWRNRRCGRQGSWFVLSGRHFRPDHHCHWRCRGWCHGRQRRRRRRDVRLQSRNLEVPADSGGGGGVGASATVNGYGGSGGQFGLYGSGGYTFGGGNNIVVGYGTPGYAGGPFYSKTGSGGGAKGGSGYSDSPYSSGGGGWSSAYGNLIGGTVTNACGGFRRL